MLISSSAPSLMVPSVSTSNAKRSESSMASVISPMDNVTLSTFVAPACTADFSTASMTPVMIPSSCMQLLRSAKPCGARAARHWYEPHTIPRRPACSGPSG